MKPGIKHILLVAPGLAGVLIFYVIPFFISVCYSFTTITLDLNFTGINNFISVLSNDYFRLALSNTLEMTVVIVPVTVFTSLMAALLFAKGSKINKPIRLALIIPVLLPSAAVIFFWKMVFPGDIFSGEITEEFIRLPVYLLFIWKNTGLNMVLFIAGFHSIPAVIYEAAELDGASAAKKHIYITLPLISPILLLATMITTVNSFRIFKEIYLLYGSYPAESIYTLQNYMNNHFLKMSYQNLSTAAVIFFVIIFVSISAGFKIIDSVNRVTGRLM
ncbi:MAG: sugar ABC transporter permease [Eubacteriales bacterium]|nr:sugar ABC transporter permease [Eubacteriales bacterium]